MTDIPTIYLPAPWGAAAVLDLIRVIPRPNRSQLRGRVAIEQIKGQDVKRGTSLLRDAALTRGKDLTRHYPWQIFIEQGVLGSVLITRCVDLTDAASGIQYNDHYNLGEKTCFRFPWGLLIGDPRCSFVPAPPALAEARPGTEQRGLFA
jgi:hypothetical protein